MYIPMQSPNVTTNAAGNKFVYGKSIVNNFINDFNGLLSTSTAQSGDITGIRFFADSGNTGYSGRFDLYKYNY